MDEKSECEAVAQKMRELAMELERDGYPAAAITDGMLMVALDAAHHRAPDSWAAPLVELPWQAGAPVPGGGRRG